MITVTTEEADVLEALEAFPSFLIALAAAWPIDRFTTKPRAGGKTLAETICQLRDTETDQFAVYIRKLRWCNNPFLHGSNAGKLSSAQDPARPWRTALYDLFQTRLGNVATVRRADLACTTRVGTFGSSKSFSMGDLVKHMHEHDIAAIADLFELATECGTWPVGYRAPAPRENTQAS